MVVLKFTEWMLCFHLSEIYNQNFRNSRIPVYKVMAHKHAQESLPCPGSITGMFWGQDGSWSGGETHPCDVRSYFDFLFFKFHSWIKINGMSEIQILVVTFLYFKKLGAIL